jgi:hypothetical protein
LQAGVNLKLKEVDFAVEFATAQQSTAHIKLYSLFNTSKENIIVYYFSFVASLVTAFFYI